MYTITIWTEIIAFQNTGTLGKVTFTSYIEKIGNSVASSAQWQQEGIAFSSGGNRKND
jgi:hypothetical protein